MHPFEARTTVLRDGRIVAIRAADARDADLAAAHLHAVAHASPRRASGEAGPRRADAARIRRLQRWCSNPRVLVLLALAPGVPHPAGMLALVPGKTKRSAHVARLSMGVHSGWQVVDLGRALLFAAVAWAVSHPALE